VDELRGLIEGGEQIGVRLNIANRCSGGLGRQGEGGEGLEGFCSIGPGDKTATMRQRLTYSALNLRSGRGCESS
jgi:hypothetical protein